MGFDFVHGVWLRTPIVGLSRVAKSKEAMSEFAYLVPLPLLEYLPAQGLTEPPGTVETFPVFLIATPKMNRILLSFLFVTTWTQAQEPTEDLQFNRDIRPLFSKTCFACHGPDANAREADLRLDLRDAAIAERDGWQPLVPGDASSSEAFLRMTEPDPQDRMPPADFHTQLTEAEKELIKRWIDQGAKYESHWAFLPPQQPNLSPGQHPIDELVRRKLESKKLSAAPLASRTTLIRRVTLDLTGLPPTPAEVRAFLNDPADEDAAYAKVVDRLLQSPHFAEQRTRYWLDAARYADTSGYQYDRIRHQWVWRDWVIDAFDRNMPFDQFTIEQIAGDLLPNATASTRLATGFHRNHPITIEGGVIDEEYRTEYVMDRVVTTTTTWMGLTFLCSRCHDHKYDPISQDDFYSFYAFFNNVPERGLNGFAPKEKIESPLHPADLERWTLAVQEAEAEVSQALKAFAPSFPTWEASLRDSLGADLQALQIESFRAQGGTELVLRDDGSILASGPNPATQTYEVQFTLRDRPLTALQLEALTHPSHVNQSTGRGSNGNFVLSEVLIDVMLPAKDAFLPVQIASAEANYEQKGYPITAAIDQKTGRAGWAVDGNSRFENSTAVFHLANPLPVGSTVRVQLDHQWGGSHTIGRFRLSVPSDVPVEIRQALQLTVQDRDKKTTEELHAFLASRFGGADYAALQKNLQEARRNQDQAAKAIPETMILTEMDEPRATFVLMRGEYDKPIPERQVQPDIPEVLGGLSTDLPRNRLGLAHWMVSRDNPLTARVTVNRFWAQLFGTGLVKTIEDFGSQGEYPFHPELLDWLAVEFMDSGWDVKALFRTMVTSHAYRQSSVLTPEALAADPENRFLARGPRHRLDAETIRDSALIVSGLLDTTIGGPSVYPYHPEGLWLEINNRPNYSSPYPHSQEPGDLYRRSVYTYWKRTVPPPSMAAFDAPEREFCIVQRSRTNTPLQAFVLLHDPQFVEAARQLGERMLTEGGLEAAERLAFGFELCLGRSPEASEMKILNRSLEASLAEFQKDPDAAQHLLQVGQSPIAEGVTPAELAAYASVARVILNLSEFITKY